MYSFKNDYSERAHPRILSALIESNMEQTEGYSFLTNSPSNQIFPILPNRLMKSFKTNIP